MIKTILNLSKKQLIFVAFLITIATLVREGDWSTGFIGGVGRGLPWFFWRETTWTDMGGYIGETDRQFALILSGVSFIGDVLFWFILLLVIKFALRLFLK